LSLNTSLEKSARQVPCVPPSAPFTAEQRAWLNGYLAGLFADAESGEAVIGAAARLDYARGSEAPKPLLILYGSQTGTAEALAKRLAGEAPRCGYAPRVLEMNSFASIDFSQEQYLAIVTSTWGDGDPPDNAVAFWNHLNSERAPKLDHLQFSVLALGDKNYSDFCGAGRKFDARLEQLGARRIHPRMDCDTDYEGAAKQWMDGLWQALKKWPLPAVSCQLSAHVVTETNAPNPPFIIYNRQNPFPARLLTNRKLNAAGSTKDTRHLEICLKDSGLNYEVGDALGVLPTNCPGLVADVIAALGCDGEEAVRTQQEQETSLRSALLRDFQITQIPRSLLQVFAERSNDEALKHLLQSESKPELDQYLYGREIIDLLLAFPEVRFTPAEFVGYLRKLQPRLYSISSSPKAHPNEVHLTVAVVRYQSHGRERKGVCSTFFAERVGDNTRVPVFVQTAHGFRLPKDGSTPIIMIGPGTGIAPFRAFLEERRESGANGRNWLFFGDQHAATDFLYQEELKAMRDSGHLTRLETAFSRDQTDKVYVQHRMLENAKEVWSWLQEGAHLYVCGDARRMAKDVDAALHQLVQTAGGRTAGQAAEYVKNLTQERRYQRDVY